jgi:hypothetical protein
MDTLSTLSLLPDNLRQSRDYARQMKGEILAKTSDLDKVKKNFKYALKAFHIILDDTEVRKHLGIRLKKKRYHAI